MSPSFSKLHTHTLSLSHSLTLSLSHSLYHSPSHQVSCEPLMSLVWQDLMDADGCELYLKEPTLLGVPMGTEIAWAQVGARDSRDLVTDKGSGLLLLECLRPR